MYVLIVYSMDVSQLTDKVLNFIKTNYIECHVISLSVNFWYSLF